MTLLYPTPRQESRDSFTLSFDFQETKQSHQERNRASVSRHIDKDPAAYRTKCREREQRQFADDPLFREGKRIRNILRAAISRIKNEMPAGYCFRLGYQSQTLRNHLESQWQPGWSWENYGTAWTIDHIRPLSDFLKSGETDPGTIHALSNIRPMSKFGNASKHKYLDTSVPRYSLPRVACTGENHHLAKLTVVQVSHIKKRLASEIRCLSKLAREYGVAVNTISQIRDGVTWKDVK